MKRRTIGVIEAAYYIGVSKDLIYQLVREKKLPHLRVGRRILFRIETLDHWMVESEQNSIDSNDQVSSYQEYGVIRKLQA